MNNIIEELDSLIDFLRWTSSQFQQHKLYFGHGTDNALDEAIALITQSLYLPRRMPDHLWLARLTMQEKRLILQRIEKRIQQRVPLPYLTKQAWFAELEFYVDERVLIPRSPLAEIIEHNFEPWLDMNSVNRVLDLGTGSGCIAIAIGHYFGVEVDAVDISPDALEVAEQNIIKHKLEDLVHTVQSDLFKNLAGIHYDLIIANPPYVDALGMNNLPAEYRHEPSSALEAGKDGLFFVRKILAEAANYLTTDGILIVEVGASAEALIEQYNDVPFVWLEFANGGDGVFLLFGEQVRQYQALFQGAK
jgi:ribosomal protein L3 glutamine methyltransferase